MSEKRSPIKNIALLRPPTVLPSLAFATVQGAPPIGPAYLAATLKEAGYDVTLIDAFGEAVDQFVEMEHTTLSINGLTAQQMVRRIPEQTDVIALSCMFSNEWVYHKQVVRLITERFPGKPVILGGEHVTAVPEYVYACCPDVLACVLGEGEETLLDLLDALDKNRSLHDVNGLFFRDQETDRLVKTPPRQRMKDLRDLPWPDWDAVPLENYLRRGLGHGVARGRNLPIVASRGCPFRCAFCSNPLMWQNRWHARPVEDVVDEIKYQVEKFRIDSVSFYHLTAIIRKDWIMQFTRRLMEEDLGITWFLPSGTRTEALDRDVLSRLHASGCRSMTYAPESGSPDTLRRIRKQIKLGNMLQSMRTAVQAKLIIKANIVLGFPGDTQRDVLKSILFIFRMAWTGIHDVAVFPFVPYPGSEFYHRLVEAGKIPRDAADYEEFLAHNTYNQISKMRSQSEFISDKQIRFLTMGGMMFFYLCQFLMRPWRVLGSVRRLASSEPLTMIERLLDGILKRFRRAGARRLGPLPDRRPDPITSSPTVIALPVLDASPSIGHSDM